MIPFATGSVPDIPHFSRELGTDSSANIDVFSLVVLPPHGIGTSHEPSVLAGDALVCVDSENLDPFEEEDPAHPEAFAEAGLTAPDDFRSPDSPRASFLPFLAIHGLMSRRF